MKKIFTKDFDKAGIRDLNNIENITFVIDFELTKFNIEVKYKKDCHYNNVKLFSNEQDLNGYCDMRRTLTTKDLLEIFTDRIQRNFYDPVNNISLCLLDKNYYKITEFGLIKNIKDNKIKLLYKINK